MLKPIVAPTFADAMQLAIAAGVTSPQQIKRSLRWRGRWFITCQVSA